jgi:hypothetical protein
MSAWQPIETAPKDGSRFLLRWYGEPMRWYGYWDERWLAWRASETLGFNCAPDFWMKPLPAAPHPPETPA